MKRLRILQAVLALSVAAAPGIASSDPDAGAGESEGHLVSVVFGCLEVPNDFHSFKSTDLRDAFAGTIAARSEDPALLSWSSGMWDFKSLLREFDPSAPPSDGADESREGMWRARHGDSEFLVQRQGWSVLFGEVRTEADEAELRKVFASYREGVERCANAEKPFPSAD